ncbi:MAG: alkaline phosphatase family protein [Oscillospiraceae bacterium]
MENRLLYINLDGFAKYYFDLIDSKKEKLPAISKLMEDGTFFEDVSTGIPSITYPMQSSLVSGAYSDITGNCYQYLDRENNCLVLCKRLNKAQTIGERLKEMEIPFVSIQQFALEEKGCSKEDKDYLYLQPGGDYKDRFDVLDSLLQTNCIKMDKKEYVFKSLPQAIFLYIDDLDTIGHNPLPHFSMTEKERVAKVQRRLMEIDKRLYQMITILQNQGLYDTTSILLTTDHGMISYKGQSKTKELVVAFKQIGFTDIKICEEGSHCPADWQVLLTSHSIQCQVYFKDSSIDLDRIKEQISQLSFVDKVMTKNDLVAEGVNLKYADLLVSPKEGMFFSSQHEAVPILCASHDSLHSKCRKVFAVMKGTSIKKGYSLSKGIKTIDLVPTLCRAVGLPVMKNATGTIINEALID